MLDGSSNLKQILFVFLGDFNQILQELKAQMSLTRNEFHKSQQKHLLCRNYRSKKKQEEGKKKKKKKKWNVIGVDGRAISKGEKLLSNSQHGRKPHIFLQPSSAFQV